MIPVNRKILIPLLLVGLFVIFNIINHYYLDWLWFENLGYSQVFFTILFTRLGLRVACFLLMSSFLFLNFYLARKTVTGLPQYNLRNPLAASYLGRLLTPRNYTLAALGASALVAFIFTGGTGHYWLELQKYLHAVPFGLQDPILNQDAGFYVFQLPFLLWLKNFLFLVAALGFLLVGSLYFVSSSSPGMPLQNWWYLFPGKRHLSFLAALLFVLKALDYRLKVYELLFSPRGVTFGASYTDVNVQLMAFQVLTVLSLVLAALLLFRSFKADLRTLPLSVVALVIASLALGTIYPGLVQKFRVEPNELVMETPYLEHNIAFTRAAYGLDRVQQENYPVGETLTFESLEKNRGTLDNIRLWDYRPLKQTYNQLQTLRPYYRFNDIDIDRYTIDGDYRQVMLSARELDQRDLPDRAKTWVNQKLKYTHGYGVTLSPVNQATPEGLPLFLLRDLPPRTDTDLALDQPEIYYGELSSPYVIVNTRTEEFNYPLGETNAYTRYEGDGGVKINSFLRKVLFALRFNDYRILLSNDITNESQVKFSRTVHQRVNKVAPFLQYDQDPYIVISQGRLYWILDAYTTTDSFPYSEPFSTAAYAFPRLNYIRNPVKVVIDAFHGWVDFYVVDPEDPLVQAYQDIFPGLFKPLEELPQGLQAHLRYPVDLFDLQSKVYAQYHMRDPRVFYNKEDEWQIPMEVYAGSPVPVEPYYTILQLPGEERPEFVLMLPYVPLRRDNMVAWLAARCDGEHYGEMVTYLFPKDTTIFGPRQVEGRIDQNAEISSQLSLWDQRGSRVIRGNLLVLPMNNSILYVEPVFLQADQGQLPELTRVIVVHGERIVMEETLQQALDRLFGEGPGELPPDLPPGIEKTLEELITQANRLLEQAQEALREGLWARYGHLQEELEKTLKDLAGLAGLD